MDMLPTADRDLLHRSEPQRQNQSSADMARGGGERRSRSQELLSTDLLETRERWNATQVAAHERLFPFSDNLTTLMFIVASDLGENPERKTYEFSFYSRDGFYDLRDITICTEPS